jgi:hypothetical protein
MLAPLQNGYERGGDLAAADLGRAGIARVRRDPESAALQTLTCGYCTMDPRFRGDDISV